MDSSFVKAPVNVPKLSGFDKSHQNLLTSKVGTITPILIDELIPGSKIHLNVALSAQLPPLAADTFMRCDIKLESFFCPLRLLAGSFESWFTDTAVSFQSSFGSISSFTDKVGFLPVIGNFGSATGPDGSTPLDRLFVTAGSLGDYLGMKVPGISQPLSSGYASALPFLCYWRVIDDWYRNTLVERPVFVRPDNSYSTSPTSSMAPASASLCAGTSPFYFFSETTRHGTSGSPSQNYIFSTLETLKLANGNYLFELAQRNFGLDYFTTATPQQQAGTASSVNVPVSGSSGTFTIASLRYANSIQQFRERNLLPGSRFQDQLRARYGANLASGVAQRALFLGGATIPVYTKGIFQNSNNVVAGSQGDPESVVTNNPFVTSGAKFGSASAVGKGLNISFEANEPGYLLVNATLVPKVTYASGIHRRFMHYIGAGSLTDMANPILQNVGPQQIWESELTGVNPTSVFGWTDRYAEFKTMEDELHGLVRTGQTLQAFALQRSFAFNSTPQISSSFLKIPTNYMDNVTAVSSQLSSYGYWLDTYFDYKVSQPLARYSLPSLQDPAYEHGKTVIVTKGGSRL